MSMLGVTVLHVWNFPNTKGFHGDRLRLQENSDINGCDLVIKLYFEINISWRCKSSNI